MKSNLHNRLSELSIEMQEMITEIRSTYTDSQKPVTKEYLEEIAGELEHCTVLMQYARTMMSPIGLWDDDMLRILAAEGYREMLRKFESNLFIRVMQGYNVSGNLLERLSNGGEYCNGDNDES